VATPPEPSSPSPVLLEECDGAGIAMRVVDANKVEISMRVEGRWGKDAPLVDKEARAIIARVRESEIGRATIAKSTPDAVVTSSADAVEAKLVLDVHVLADGIHKLVEATVSEVMKG
jgi:hypothetical protein